MKIKTILVLIILLSITTIACSKTNTSGQVFYNDKTGGCIDDTDCVSGRICVNGICKIPPKPVIRNSCFDSDSGINFNVSGYVAGQMNNTNYTFYDSCAYNKTLTERYCQNTTPKSTSFNCSGPCYNGACN